MRYREMPPPDELAPWIRCAWVFEASAHDAAPERIVPDGRPELIVHAGAPFAEIHEAGPPRPQPAALLAGQLTRPLALRSTGAALVVGVRFHPDGARGFFGRPMREANDRRVPLDAIVAGSGRALARRLASLADDNARVDAVFDVVRTRLQAARPVPDGIVRGAVARLEADPQAAIEDLCAEASIGRRQLERRFADTVGIGPALLGSILRFRRAFDLLERDAARAWTDAAIAAGYYDQSHFIREFHRFVGCRPGEFFRPRPSLAQALVVPTEP